MLLFRSYRIGCRIPNRLSPPTSEASGWKPPSTLIAEADQRHDDEQAPFTASEGRARALIQTLGPFICFPNNRRLEEDTHADGGFGEEIIDPRNFATGKLTPCSLTGNVPACLAPVSKIAILLSLDTKRFLRR
jgi:hypothetical protein